MVRLICWFWIIPGFNYQDLEALTIEVFGMMTGDMEQYWGSSDFEDFLSSFASTIVTSSFVSSLNHKKINKYFLLHIPIEFWLIHKGKYFFIGMFFYSYPECSHTPPPQRRGLNIKSVGLVRYDIFFSEPLYILVICAT